MRLKCYLAYCPPTKAAQGPADYGRADGNAPRYESSFCFVALGALLRRKGFFNAVPSVDGRAQKMFYRGNPITSRKAKALRPIWGTSP